MFYFLFLRILQDVSKDFEKAISGADSTEVSTKELSGGAKINRIFNYFRILRMTIFAYEVNKKSIRLFYTTYKPNAYLKLI